jgi:hypothetical protein
MSFADPPAKYQIAQASRMLKKTGQMEIGGGK